MSDALVLDSPQLSTWTIYWSPTDYPGQYVVREYRIGRDGFPKPVVEPVYVGASLDEARESIPPPAVNMGRTERCAAHIVETWL